MAGVVVFPADLCRWHRGANLGGAAASRVVGRTTKHREHQKCKSLGQSARSPNGAEFSVSNGHSSRAGSPLWLVPRISTMAQRDWLHLDHARVCFRCVGIGRKPLFLQRCVHSGGHVVCDSGPYQIVRHPGYAGNIPPLLGIVFAFGSVWTLVPAAVALIITVIRTVLEDQTLQEE